MTARDFCYWLQGFFEITDANPPVDGRAGLTASQADRIRRHLSMVFAHEIDPAAGDATVQAKLDAIHHPKHASGAVPRC